MASRGGGTDNNTNQDDEFYDEDYSGNSNAKKESKLKQKFSGLVNKF